MKPIRSSPIRRTNSILGVALMASIVAQAQPSPAPLSAATRPIDPDRVETPPAEQIVQRNANARGGLDAWRAITTLAENGRVEHGQTQGPGTRPGLTPGGPHALQQPLPFTLQFKRPHKMRLQMDLGDLHALQIFDGVHGWTLQPSADGPMVHAYTAAEAAAAAEQMDPEGPLLDAAAKGTAVAFDGGDTVEGHRAFKLKLTLKGGGERHVWIDAQTFLDLKIDGTRVIDGKPWRAETYFYDWKQTGAVKLPHRIETEVNGVRTSSRVLVDRVRVNVPLDDSVFSLPIAGAPPAGTAVAPPSAADSGGETKHGPN